MVDWKLNLANYFEELRILQESKQEALDNFEQFCEFVAEPAFESLQEELQQYGIRSRTRTERGKSIALLIYFPKSRIDNFHYVIRLPKNALELTLKLKIRGRKNKSSPFQDSEQPFMKDIAPREVLKLEKSAVIQDVIEYYRHFNFEVFTAQD